MIVQTFYYFKIIKIVHWSELNWWFRIDTETFNTQIRFISSYVPAMAICTLIKPSCRKEHISFNNSFLVLCQLLLFKMMHSIPWLDISFVLKFCQYFIFIYEKGVVLYCCIPFCVHTLDLWSYLQKSVSLHDPHVTAVAIWHNFILVYFYLIAV